MASLYIHIPFCLQKCNYCDFSSFAGLDSLYPRYVKAVKKEIVDLFFAGETEPLDTLFFGGGTPSVLTASQIEELIACCREYPGLAEKAEVSIEANPKTVDFMKLLQLRQAGVNRLSVGVQSFIDAELDMLGRLHTAQQSWDCVDDAISSGFHNISLDLIYGLPGQTPEHWRWNIESALSLNIQHLSMYQLSVEEDTPLARSVERQELTFPEEEEVLQMDAISSRLTGDAGVEQYEISNYARRGYQCRHNLNYWHNGDYLAAGAGAVGHRRGERWTNIKKPERYCEMVEEGENIVQERENLSQEESFRESVVVGLRLIKGVEFGHLEDRYGIHLRDYYGETLTPLLKNGLIEFTASHLRLTNKGRYIANQVLAELV